MSNIEFYIPEDQQIPTKLRLKKDNINIYYGRCSDRFGYEFEVYNSSSEEEGFNLIKEIAGIMCDQSYDNYAGWVIVSINKIEYKIQDWGNYGKWVVEFRIRDSY